MYSTWVFSSTYIAMPQPGGKWGSFPRNPGKFAKAEEQPRPQPAIRIDSSRKL